MGRRKQGLKLEGIQLVLCLTSQTQAVNGHLDFTLNQIAVRLIIACLHFHRV